MKQVSEKLLYVVHDSYGHGVHNIIIHTAVSHKFQFSRNQSCVLEFMNKFHNKNP